MRCHCKDLDGSLVAVIALSRSSFTVFLKNMRWVMVNLINATGVIMYGIEYFIHKSRIHITFLNQAIYQQSFLLLCKQYLFYLVWRVYFVIYCVCVVSWMKIKIAKSLLSYFNFVKNINVISSVFMICSGRQMRWRKCLLPILC